MWKSEHRRAADRHGLRYPCELNDSEWALIEAAIPPANRGRCRREVVREILNAIFYVLSVGCQWQALPKDLPPKHRAFILHPVRLGRALERTHHALYIETREREGAGRANERELSTVRALGPLNTPSSRFPYGSPSPGVRLSSTCSRPTLAKVSVR
jgi:transposase